MTTDIINQALAVDRKKRFYAFLIDYIPLGILVAIIFYFFFGVDELLSNRLDNPSDLEARESLAFAKSNIRFSILLVFAVYSFITEVSMAQATIGKRLMKLKVVDQNGNRMTTKTAAIRSVSKILSGFIVFIGFGWALLDKKRQGWHDKIAKTYVVNA